MLLNNLLNNKSNKKNTIRHLYRITINLLEYAYISSYVGCTYTILFTCIINRIQEKKTNHLHNPFNYHIHIHRNFWFYEYVHLQHHNHKRNHKHQISIYLAKTSSMNPHPKMTWKFYLNDSKDLLKLPLFMAITKTK